MGLRAVVSKGDRRKSLEVIRDALASELEIAEGTAAAAVAKELRAVLADIAALPEEKGGSALDDIVASVARLDDHRRSRRPAAAGS